jgi:hypothetical protein
MAAKQKDPKRRNQKAVSRRDFVKSGAAAGVGAAVLSTSGTALAQGFPRSARSDGTTRQTSSSSAQAAWDFLPPFVRAISERRSSSSIRTSIPAARCSTAAARFSLGGGDPLQKRDIEGTGDAEGFVTAPRQHSIAELTGGSRLPVQGPHRLVGDGCRGAGAVPVQRTRSPSRVCRQLLRHQGIPDGELRPHGRISGTHGNGGMSRARRAVTFFMEGATTDIKKGTISKQDAGIAGKSSSHFAPRFMEDGTKVASKGARTNGAALARPLEFSAREKGVRFILNRHMDEIIREQQFSGRVVGIRASYSPRFDPQTGAQLQSLWQNGNIDDRAETIYIRARKAVIIGAGGHGANAQFRSMFYPAWREPAFVSSGWALLGRAVRTPAASSRECGSGRISPACSRTSPTAARSISRGTWRRAIPTPICFPDIRRSRCAARRASTSRPIRSSI